jgi:N-acetylneuraminate synthase/N,N'-diacetyllegionaminate synthase
MPTSNKNRCYLIAEVGSNHDGSLKRAIELIRLAKHSGADAVKFQSFQAKTLIYKDHPAWNVVEANQLPMAWYPELKKVADHEGIHFFSTPFDLESLSLLVSLAVPAIKIASGDITHFTLLQKVAETQLPIYLSTGAATIQEIEEALKVLKLAKAGPITLMHCTSLYPAEPHLANLKAITTLQKHFGLPCGFSDHTLGSVAPLGAVTLGAVAIEKHFTNDKSRQGPDHPHSMNPHEFKKMVEKIRQLESSLGDGVKGPFPQEKEERIWARRGVYANQAIPAGTALLPHMVKLVRPAPLEGIFASQIDQMKGKKTKRLIKEDQLIRWDDITS